jgi:type I restriction enzyme S subunit
MVKEKIPDGWKWSTLGKECTINPTRPKGLQANDHQETSFVPMEAVDGDLGIIAGIKIVSFEKVKKGYTYFEENDVLFAKITPCMQNKKSAIARNLINNFGFGSTEFYILRCKERVIPEWIYYFVRNKQFVDEAETHFTGTVGQQRVPKSFLEEYPLLVPPISVQKEIVSKLEKQMTEIEGIKEEFWNQLNAINQFSASILNEIFGKYEVPDEV